MCRGGHFPRGRAAKTQDESLPGSLTRVKRGEGRYSQVLACGAVSDPTIRGRIQKEGKMQPCFAS